MQKTSETNKLLDKSYAEFTAHLRAKPRWRAWAPWNSLADWDQFPSATLDISNFVSPPSSVAQTFGSVSGTQIYGLVLIPITNVPQGQLKVSAWWNGTFLPPNGFGVRMQAPVGNLSTVIDGYYLGGIIFNGGSASLTAIASNASVFSASAAAVNLGAGSWHQYSFTWWSDPTLGFIARTAYFSGSFITFTNDFVDAGDRFKASSLNRVGLIDSFHIGGGGGSDGATVDEWDDFSLFTP
jgi:hypothetical protein